MEAGLRPDASTLPSDAEWCTSLTASPSEKPRLPARVGNVAGERRKGIVKAVTRQALKLDEHEPRLIHAHCRERSGTALLPAYEPAGLA
jgi:hypothetical protein